jgi:hypothetical protein
MALDLTLARHQFARQWFGTMDMSYMRDSEEEQVGYDAGVDFNQLPADTALINAKIAVDQAKQSGLNTRYSYMQAWQRHEQQLDEFKMMPSMPTRTEIVLTMSEQQGVKTSVRSVAIKYRADWQKQ